MKPVSTSMPNHRDQTRWFPIWNVTDRRTVPSFGCMCFSHGLPKNSSDGPSVSTGRLFVNPNGLSHRLNDYPYGTSIYDGQGVIRVHQPARVIPSGSGKDFWDDGIPIGQTNILASPQHFWFNLDSKIPPDKPGRGTRDWPVLALIIRAPASLSLASGQPNPDPYENFYPGDRVTFASNHFFLRRWGGDFPPRIAGEAAADLDVPGRASWRVIAAECAEFQAGSYGVGAASFGLYWIEPWDREATSYLNGVAGCIFDPIIGSPGDAEAAIKFMSFTGSSSDATDYGTSNGFGGLGVIPFSTRGLYSLSDDGITLTINQPGTYTVELFFRCLSGLAEPIGGTYGEPDQKLHHRSASAYLNFTGRRLIDTIYGQRVASVGASFPLRKFVTAVNFGSSTTTMGWTNPNLVSANSKGVLSLKAGDTLTFVLEAADIFGLGVPVHYHRDAAQVRVLLSAFDPVLSVVSTHSSPQDT